jgi:hypothetical protein
VRRGRAERDEGDDDSACQLDEEHEALAIDTVDESAGRQRDDEPG